MKPDDPIFPPRAAAEYLQTTTGTLAWWRHVGRGPGYVSVKAASSIANRFWTPFSKRASSNRRPHEWPRLKKARPGWQPGRLGTPSFICHDGTAPKLVPHVLTASPLLARAGRDRSR